MYAWENLRRLRFNEQNTIPMSITQMRCPHQMFQSRRLHAVSEAAINAVYYAKKKDSAAENSSGPPITNPLKTKSVLRTRSAKKEEAPAQLASIVVKSDCVEITLPTNINKFTMEGLDKLIIWTK